MSPILCADQSFPRSGMRNLHKGPYHLVQGTNNRSQLRFSVFLSERPHPPSLIPSSPRRIVQGLQRKLGPRRETLRRAHLWFPRGCISLLQLLSCISLLQLLGYISLLQRPVANPLIQRQRLFARTSLTHCGGMPPHPPKPLGGCLGSPRTR